MDCIGSFVPILSLYVLDAFNGIRKWAFVMNPHAYLKSSARVLKIKPTQPPDGVLIPELINVL